MANYKQLPDPAFQPKRVHQKRYKIIKKSTKLIKYNEHILKPPTAINILRSLFLFFKSVVLSYIPLNNRMV